MSEDSANYKAALYAIDMMKDENKLLKATIVRMRGEIDQLHRALEEAMRAPPWDSIHPQQEDRNVIEHQERPGESR